MVDQKFCVSRTFPIRLPARTNAVLNAVASGNLKVRIEKIFPLADAGAAHTLLESRRTAGKVLLKP